MTFEDLNREVLVREAWESATENGYGDWLLTAPTLDVAIDMMDGDGYIEEEFADDFDALVELVKKIQERGGL